MTIHVDAKWWPPGEEDSGHIAVVEVERTDEDEVAFWIRTFDGQQTNVYVTCDDGQVLLNQLKAALAIDWASK